MELLSIDSKQEEITLMNYMNKEGSFINFSLKNFVVAINGLRENMSFRGAKHHFNQTFIIIF